MELSGTISVIMETKSYGDNGFQKRDFVINTGGEYSQEIKMELVKDKCDIIDDFEVGDEVTVSFNIRGNQNNDRYYVNLHAWKITRN